MIRRLTNKAVYLLIMILTVLAIIGIGYAYSQAVPDPGHGADRLWIMIAGVEKTLQAAIDNNDFGSKWNLNGANIYRTDGYAGIGTSTPIGKLDVFRDGERMSIGTDANNPAIELRNEDADGGVYPYIDFSNDAATDFDARFILYDNNQIGIQGAKLYVSEGLRCGYLGAIWAVTPSVVNSLVVTVPDVCKNYDGCRLRVVTWYGGAYLYRVISTEYSQWGDYNQGWASGTNGGTNGDAVYGTITYISYAPAPTASYAYLYDDYPGLDQDQDHWTLICRYMPCYLYVC